MLVVSALLADVMMVSSSLASPAVVESVVGTAMVVTSSCKVVDAVDADGSDTVDGDNDDDGKDDEDGKVTISSWLSDSTGEEGT